MYTTTGEKLSWAEFEARRNTGEELYIGEYPKGECAGIRCTDGILWN